MQLWLLPGHRNVEALVARGHLAALSIVAPLAACMAFLLAAASPLRAEVGSKIFLGDPTLNCEVDARWTTPTGYWPLRFTLTPSATPSPNDRSLKIHCQIYTQATTTRHVFIPAGTVKPIRFTIPVLCGGSGDLRFHIEEAGAPLPGFSGNISTYGYGVIEEGVPCTLYIGNPAKDGTSTADRWFDRIGRNSPTQVNSVSLTPADLPEEWISYTGLDIVVLQATEIARLADEYPNRWEAIRKWCAAGGNLVVFGAGDNWQYLPSIESHLGLPQITSTSEGIEPGERGWQRPNKEDDTDPNLGPQFSRSPPSPLNTPVQSYAVPGVPQEEFGVEAADIQREIPLAPEPSPPPRDLKSAIDRAMINRGILGPQEQIGARASRFVIRNYALGRVAVFATSDPVQLDSNAVWLLNALGSNRRLWYQRHGLSSHTDNHDFWNFLIPGVGLPPVTAFQVLITMFVVVIGPLNFWWLKRKRKLPLLILTIPLFALALSVLLLGYFVARDGFSTRLRARNITLLDQQRGEAVSWARLSYYSGMTPGGSLEFDEDVAAIPYYDVLPATQRRGGSRNLELAWRPDIDPGLTASEPTRQYFQGGWIMPRTPFQMMNLRVRASERRIEVEPGADGVQVVNKLGSEILALWLCDEQGKVHSLPAGGLAENARGSLDSSDWAKVTGELYAAIEPATPQLPTDIDFGRFRSRMRYYNYRQVNFPAPVDYRTSCLEQTIGDLISRRQNNVKNWLKPRAYVAVLRSDPEVATGYRRLSLESSLHVTIGNW